MGFEYDDHPDLRREEDEFTKPEFEKEAKQSFEPPDKDYLLWELDEALDISLDEFHDMEERPRINLVRTVEGKLLLGNQITIMQALKLLLEEKKDEPDRETT